MNETTIVKCGGFHYVRRGAVFALCVHILSQEFSLHTAFARRLLADGDENY